MILATILMCLIKEKKTVLSKGEILVSWFCFARKWKFSFLILFCQKVKILVFWFCFVKKWKFSFLILFCQFAFATDLDCGRCLYTEIHLKIFGCLIFVSTCCNKETIVHHIRFWKWFWEILSEMYETWDPHSPNTYFPAPSRRRARMVGHYICMKSKVHQALRR